MVTLSYLFFWSSVPVVQINTVHFSHRQVLLFKPIIWIPRQNCLLTTKTQGTKLSLEKNTKWKFLRGWILNNWNEFAYHQHSLAGATSRTVLLDCPIGSALHYCIPLLPLYIYWADKQSHLLNYNLRVNFWGPLRV